MARPLQPGAPSFTLSAYGSDGSFFCEEFMTRMEHIEKQLVENGITVINWTTDGAASGSLHKISTTNS